MNRITIIIALVALLSACQKNSFESCVEYYQEQAKKDHPDEWELMSDVSIRMNCKVQ